MNELIQIAENLSVAPASNDIVFCCDNVEIMKLTPEGMTYMGNLVKDAGEAHRLFKDANE
jgi:hypothetical protein